MRPNPTAHILRPQWRARVRTLLATEPRPVRTALVLQFTRRLPGPTSSTPVFAKGATR